MRSDMDVASFQQRLSHVADELRTSLENEHYVRRLAFKEGKNVQELLMMRGLGVQPSIVDKSFLEDVDLIQARRVLLLGNQGSGKSLVLQFSFLIAVDQFIANANAPIPLFLDLDTDLGS